MILIDGTNEKREIVISLIYVPVYIIDKVKLPYIYIFFIFDFLKRVWNGI